MEKGDKLAWKQSADMMQSTNTVRWQVTAK